MGEPGIKFHISNIKNAPARFVLQAVVVFCATLAVLFVLLLAAYALPGGPVRKNIADSVPLLQSEGLYPEFFGVKLFQMDNYTDTIMLFEAATADEAPALQSMMTNTAYNVDNFETLPDDLALYLSQSVTAGNNAKLQPFSYARYWHGYLAYLRPLLLLFTYGQIRIINYLVLGVLLALVLWRTEKRCGRSAAVWFAVSQLAVTVWWVPRQMQYFSCFVVAYAACLWVLWSKQRCNAATLALGLLCTGMCTAFFDLLVTPILTLGLAVTLWLLRKPDAAQPAQTPLQRCGAVLGASVAWGVGYLGCWGSKWLLAGAVTGQDIVGDALHQIGVRTTADTWHGMELSWGNIVGFVYSSLNDRGLFWPVAALLVLGIVAVGLCLRGRGALWDGTPLLLCSLMAPTWFCLLRTHSIQHGWFTWRALSVTVFALLAFLQRSCSVQMPRRRLAQRRAKHK